MIATALLLSLCCCTTVSVGTSETGYYSSWNTQNAEEYEKLFSLFNSYGGSVCMGISGPQADKERAIEIATQKCVQYLAFTRGLAMQVNFGSVTNSGSEKIGLDYGVIGGTSDALFNEVANEFEIVEVKWFGGKIGAAVFARLPGMASVKKVGAVLNSKTPEIRGRYVAVATSEFSYSDFADAIEAATFRVAEALIHSHTGTINVSNNITETTTNQYKSDSYSISGNRLEGFAVLAYEYNIEENKVYALAVCNR